MNTATPPSAGPPWGAAVAALGLDGPPLEWVLTLLEETDPADAYRWCPDGEWLLRLLGALHDCGFATRQTLGLASAAAVRAALPLLGATAGPAVSTVVAVERWCRGAGTVDEVAAAMAANDRARNRAREDAVREGGTEASRVAYYAHTSVHSAAVVVTHPKRSGAATAAHAVATSAYAAACAVSRRDRRDSSGPSAAFAALWHAEMADAVRAAVPWRDVARALD